MIAHMAITPPSTPPVIGTTRFERGVGCESVEASLGIGEKVVEVADEITNEVVLESVVDSTDEVDLEVAVADVVVDELVDENALEVAVPNLVDGFVLVGKSVLVEASSPNGGSGSKAAAIEVTLDRAPCARSARGQRPCEHGLLLQQPRKVGFVTAQVYHWTGQPDSSHNRFSTHQA